MTKKIVKISMGMGAFAIALIFAIMGFMTLLADEAAACELKSELIAGQNYDAGYVNLRHPSYYTDEFVIYIQATDGWQITETHVAVGTSLDDIPQTRNGNPKIGRFPYSSEHDPAVYSTYYILDLDDYEGLYDETTKIYSGTLYIAVHVVVQIERTVTVDGITYTYYQEETAWADTYGIPFNDKGWAMYIKMDF